MGGPKIPRPIPPPPPPSVDQAATAADQANQLRKRQGAAATLLTGPGSGVGSPPMTAGARLLGGASTSAAA